MDSLRVRALLRAATDAEISEGLERNPGSRRLADAGWTPSWFEVRVFHAGGEDEIEHQFSLVWGAPGHDPHELAGEELEHALEEVLRNLRDMEGLAVWPEDVTDREIEVTA